MGESGLSKTEAKRFLAQADMQRALMTGGNESDVGVWRQGLVGCSRKTLSLKGSGGDGAVGSSGSGGKTNSSSKSIKANSNACAAIQYVPCRSHVFPPSAWHPPSDAGDLPDAALLPAAIFGANCRRSNSVSWANPHCLAYFIAATCVVCDVGQEVRGGGQRFFYGHNDDVTSISCHPSSNIAASGQMGKDAKIILWSTTSMETVLEISGHHSTSVDILQWSPCGSFLCSIGGDVHHTLIVYEFSSPLDSSLPPLSEFKLFKIRSRGRAHASAVTCCRWPPAVQSSTFVTCGDKHVKLWEVDGTVRQLSFNPLQPHAVTCVCYLTREEMFTGSSDGSLCLWRSGRLVYSVVAHSDAGGRGVTAVASCWGGGGVWSCGSDGCLVRWVVDSAADIPMVMGDVYSLTKLLETPTLLPSSQLSATSISVRPGYAGQVALGLPCGSVVLFDAGLEGGGGSVARITDGGGGEMIKALTGLHKSPHLFLSASGDCSLSLFDGISKQRIAWYQLPAPAVSIDVSSDDCLVAVGHCAGLVTTWSLASMLPSPPPSQVKVGYTLIITTAGSVPASPLPSTSSSSSPSSSTTVASASSDVPSNVGHGGAPHGLSARLIGAQSF